MKKNRKVRSGAVWVTLGNLVTILCKIFTVAVLARLISPEQFGVWAIFILIFELVKVVYVPVVRKSIILSSRGVTELVGSALIVSLGLASCLSFVFYLGSPLITEFFSVSDYEQAFQLIGFLFVLEALNNPIRSAFEKKLSFRRLSIIRIGSTIIFDGILTIFLAWMGYGVWALFFGLLSREIFVLFCLVIGLQWEVFVPNRQSIREILRDSFSVPMAGVFNSIALQGDYFIVSKMFDTMSLGMYSRAYKIMSLPTQLLSTSLNQVALPVLVGLERDTDKLKDIYQKLLYLVAMLTIPLSTLIFCYSNLLVDLMLGDAWNDVVPLLNVLCLGIFVRVAYKIPAVILNVYSEFRVLVLCQAFYALSVLAFCYAFTIMGVQGIAWGAVVSIFLFHLSMTLVVNKKLQVSLREYCDSIFPSLVWAVITLTVSVISSRIVDSLFFSFLLTIGVMLLSLAICWVVIGRKAFGRHCEWWIKFILNRKRKSDAD